MGGGGKQPRTNFLASLGAGVRERFQSVLDHVFWAHLHDFALDSLVGADLLEVAGVRLGAIERAIRIDFQVWICHSFSLNRGPFLFFVGGFERLLFHVLDGSQKTARGHGDDSIE